MHSSSNPTLPSTYQGSSLAKRLNIVGTVTCILDTAINLTSRRSETVSHFLSDTLPYYVSATYYLLPSVTLFGYFIKNVVTEGCNKSACVGHDSEDKARALVEELNDVDGFKAFIADNPGAQEALMSKVKSMQDNGYMDKIDVFINILYFTLRALQGIVIIIKANQWASGDTHQAITDWTDFISNVINAAYLLTMLIHNNCHKHTQNRHTLFAGQKVEATQSAHFEPNREGQDEKDRLILEV